MFSKASSEEENSPSPPPVPESKVELESNLISEEARMIEDEVDDLDDISLSQEERRKAYGDPRTSQMASVGIVKDEIDDISDEDSDLVIDEPEEDTPREEEVESDQEFDSERPMESEEREMKPSLPSVMFLADQRALLQPKTELQRKPEQAIQPKSRVAAQSRGATSSNTQAASSSPAPAAPFTPYFNLDILATVASMNRLKQPSFTLKLSRIQLKIQFFTYADFLTVPIFVPILSKEKLAKLRRCISRVSFRLKKFGPNKLLPQPI